MGAGAVFHQIAVAADDTTVAGRTVVADGESGAVGYVDTAATAGERTDRLTLVDAQRTSVGDDHRTGVDNGLAVGEGENAVADRGRAGVGVAAGKNQRARAALGQAAIGDYARHGGGVAHREGAGA